MTSGDRYRKRAVECIDAADHATCPERKITLLQLAQRWLMLAHQLDQKGGDRVSDDATPSQRVR